MNKKNRGLFDRCFSVSLWIGLVIIAVGYTFFPILGVKYDSLVGKESAREKLIHEVAAAYATKAGLDQAPDLVISKDPRAPLAARAILFNGIIAVSPSLLDPTKYTDDDVRGVVAHEIGHLVRWDSYRVWNQFDADWAREKELAADTFAAGITSCEIMHALIRNHLDGAMAGYNNPDDPHPHPDARMKAAGTCA